jgi:Mg2+ and Co2+ transporter CorA
MLSDRMVGAIKKLDPRLPASLNTFRDETFELQENFLRFSQRYLFTEISGRTHIRDLFHMIRTHLCIDRLHQEARSDIADMVHYLDSTTLRKQSGSMHRLTVVTVMGLTGTFATGFLGMNLLSAAEEPLSVKALYFGAICGVAAILTGLAVVYSSPLSRLLEKIAGENRKW